MQRRCRHSAFHNTTAIVGAGVLGLPFAMKYLTWSGGVIVMCLSWGTSLYTLWQVHAPERWRLQAFVFSSAAVRQAQMLRCGASHLEWEVGSVFALTQEQMITVLTQVSWVFAHGFHTMCRRTM